MTFEAKKILVPTDFSDLATEALVFAGDLARKLGAEVTVLYADEFLPPPYFTSTQVDEMVALLGRSRDLAAEQLESYAREHLGEGVAIRSIVAKALPVTAILDYAERERPDMIVMGTHGRSGMSRLMLGSVAERVLRETGVPLLTVRSGGAERRSIRRIVCPVNFTGVARDAVEHAVSLAMALDAALDFLHVVEKGGTPAAAEEMKKICDWVPEKAKVNCRFEEMAVGSDPAEQILDYAGETGADLLVIGAQHRKFSDTTIIGTTSVRIVRHAPLPVLTVTRREAPVESETDEAARPVGQLV
jgi:nucleotide-binding universal stress UspA family protein